MKLTRLDKLILQGAVGNFNERMGPRSTHSRSISPAGPLARGQFTRRSIHLGGELARVSCDSVGHGAELTARSESFRLKVQDGELESIWPAQPAG